MSGEMSRRELFGRTAATAFLVTTGLGTGLGCANQHEIRADGVSTIFQLTNEQIRGGNNWVVYRGRVNGSYAKGINRYDPSEDNPRAGWVFEIDGREVNGSNIDPFSYVPHRGQIITWHVAEVS